jgi:hypothetical protein
MLISAWLFIAMIGNFYRWTVREIRQLGYAPHIAFRYARFFFVSMLSVCTVAGVLNIPPEVVTGSNTGSGNSPAGARTGITSPDFFGLRRY